MDDTNDTKRTGTSPLVMTTAKMERIVALIGACADTISALTPAQRTLLDELGINTPDLWLGMMQIALDTDAHLNASAEAAPAPKG